MSFIISEFIKPVVYQSLILYFILCISILLPSSILFQHQSIFKCESCAQIANIVDTTRANEPFFYHEAWKSGEANSNQKHLSGVLSFAKGPERKEWISEKNTVWWFHTSYSDSRAAKMVPGVQPHS